ncbi:hypothetical protein [Nocardia sp. JMUB6875]|uniref:hypothetical protein n=1 Tax=Nocardia sp. JMUB6875 TaxID=3158170 RepID=UPI0034E8A101
MAAMLMRTDPFRDLDRLTQAVFGTPARPAVMPMDAWRDDDALEFELRLTPSAGPRFDALTARYREAADLIAILSAPVTQDRDPAIES